MNADERRWVRRCGMIAILPWLVASAITSLVTGCGVQPPASTTFAFSYDILSERPASSPIDAASIIDVDIVESRFDIVDDKGFRKSSVSVRVAATTEHGAELAIAEDDRRVEFVRRYDDGAIALTAVIDHGDNALTLFDPPLVIAPATLAPGETFASESAMRVVALDNPGKQRERGTCRRTIAYTNDATLLITPGEIQVARLDIHFEADLRLANAEETTTMYACRGETPGALRTPLKGVILQQSVEKIVILGAFSRTTERTLVRIE